MAAVPTILALKLCQICGVGPLDFQIKSLILAAQKHLARLWSNHLS